MKRHVLIYGLIGGIALLKWTEYRFLVIEHSVEIYGGLIAATTNATGTIALASILLNRLESEYQE